MAYIVPITIIAVLLLGAAKKVNVYNAFVDGVKKSFGLSISVFPYLAAMFLTVNALKASGADTALAKLLAPPFKLLGVPAEVVNLVLLKPFSGSGSLALLSDIYKNYGTDSYIGRCASVIAGSGETVFYLASVYFAEAKTKRTGFAVPLALLCNFLSAIVACALCKVT